MEGGRRSQSWCGELAVQSAKLNLEREELILVRDQNGLKVPRSTAAPTLNKYFLCAVFMMDFIVECIAWKSARSTSFLIEARNFSHNA